MNEFFQLLNQLHEMESKSLNPCIMLLNCKNNSQISAKLVKKKLTSIQRYFLKIFILTYIILLYVLRYCIC